MRGRTSYRGQPLLLRDLGVPAQLLRATDNLGSLRDSTYPLSWEPQPTFFQLDNRGRPSFSNGGTRESTDGVPWVPSPYGRTSTNNRKSLLDRSDSRKAKSRWGTLSPGTPQSKKQNSYRRSFSWDGSGEKLGLSRSVTNDSFALGAGVSSLWSIYNPFLSSSEASHLQAWPRSGFAASQDGDPFVMHDGTRNSDGQLATRGRLGTMIDAIMPKAVQRRLTNISYLRRCSIWQTYETAKKRGAELQRARWAQLVFEYAVYAILLAFAYFVLVGVPLWRGAVYWLYWLVAHKFVIAGGFSITGTK